MAFAITIGAFFSSKAQRGDSVPPSIEINTIALLNPGNITQGLVIGESMEKVVQILGQPTKITEQYFETDEVTAKVYYYNQNKLYFVYNKLNIFDLFDGSIAIGTINGRNFKIGDKLQLVTNSRGTSVSFYEFPLNGRNPGAFNKISYSTICDIDAKNGSTYIDAHLGLLFDSQDQLVYIYMHDN